MFRQSPRRDERSNAKNVRCKLDNRLRCHVVITKNDPCLHTKEQLHQVLKVRMNKLTGSKTDPCCVVSAPASAVSCRPNPMSSQDHELTENLLESFLFFRQLPRK